MAGKPRRKSPSTPSDSGAGHLGADDRGNVTWEWRDDPNLLADDTFGGVERLRALVDPQLEIKEDDSPTGILRGNSKGLKSGYNPYNSGALGKRSWKKKKDLRELSKWIKLRKRMAAKKDEE